MRIPFGLTCLAALALAAPLASAQNLYQWKDANGVTHYSDKPPTRVDVPGKRIDARDSEARGATAAVEAPAENPQCTTARLNAQLLKNAAPVHEMGADGKPGKELGAEERASQLALAEAASKAYCKPLAGK